MKRILLIGLFIGSGFAPVAIPNNPASKSTITGEIKRVAGAVEDVAKDAVRAGAWLADVASAEFKAGYEMAFINAKEAELKLRKLALSAKGTISTEAQKAIDAAKIEFQKAREELAKYEYRFEATKIGEAYYATKEAL